MGMDTRRSLCNTYFNIRNIRITDDEIIFELDDTSKHCIGRLENKCFFVLFDAEGVSIEDGNLIGGCIIDSAIHVKRKGKQKVACGLAYVNHKGRFIEKKIDV